MSKIKKQIEEEFAQAERYVGRLVRNIAMPGMMPFLSNKGWHPPIDVYETEREIIVYVETAGVEPANLAVVAETNSVRISGKRQRPIKEQVCRIHQLEIDHGFFQRTIILSVPVDVEKTTSSYKDGFLEIRLPKAALVGRVRIEIA